MGVNTTLQMIYTLFRPSLWESFCCSEQNDVLPCFSKNNLLLRINSLQNIIKLNGQYLDNQLKNSTSSLLETVHRDMSESYLSSENLFELNEKVHFLEFAVTNMEPAAKVHELVRELFQHMQVQKDTICKDLMDMFQCLWVDDNPEGYTESYEYNPDLAFDISLGAEVEIPSFSKENTPAQAPSLSAYRQAILSYPGENIELEKEVIESLFKSRHISSSDYILSSKNQAGQEAAISIPRQAFVDLPRTTILQLNEKTLVNKLSEPKQQLEAEEICAKLFKALNKEVDLFQNLCKLITYNSLADLWIKLSNFCMHTNFGIHLSPAKQIHLTIDITPHTIIINHLVICSLFVACEIPSHDFKNFLTNQHIIAERDTIIGKEALRKGCIDKSVLVSEMYSKFYDSEQAALEAVQKTNYTGRGLDLARSRTWDVNSAKDPGELSRSSHPKF